MAKESKKTEPAEQFSDDPGPRPLVFVAQQVKVCAACGDKMGDDAKVVPLNPRLADKSARSYAVQPVVAIATLLLLAGLAVLVWHGVFTAEQYIHMFFVVVAAVFVVPYGIRGIGHIVRKWLS